MPDTTKSGPMTAEDLNLLGYTLVTQETPREAGLAGLNCRVFRGVDSGFERAKHAFVYLMANTTQQSLRRHVDTLRSFAQPTFVVIPQSLKSSAAGRLLQRELPQRCRVYDDMMWDRVSSLLSSYLDHVSSQVAALKTDHYIPPALDRLPANRDPVDFLVEFCARETTEEDNIVVVQANPGVGKTALATLVASKLAATSGRAKVVPVFLPADIWRTLEPESVPDVLRKMDFPLGNDEDAWHRLLRQGYIALIFDGFDELRNDDQSPKERFDGLRSIAEASNARIIVTCRSSFWDREIAGTVGHDVNLLRIEPFTRKHRNAYWRARLKTDDKVRAAAALHGRYMGAQGGKDFELFKLPNCASMIADCIERLGHTDNSVGLSESVASAPTDRDLVDTFFREVMERERIRQSLVTSTDATRSAFEELAVYSDEDDFDTDLLEIFGIDPRDFSGLRDHALLRNVSDNRFRFRYPAVQQRFRASRFLAALLSGDLQNRGLGDCRELVTKEADGTSEFPAQVAQIMTDEELPSAADCHAATDHPDLKSLVFHLLVARVAVMADGASREDRWREFVKLLGGTRREIHGLSVRGTIEGFNLPDFTIRDSRFTDLVLAPPVRSLTFENCRFDGSLVVPPEADFVKCQGREGAQLVLFGAAHERLPTQEDTKQYLLRVVGRFVERRGGYRTVRESDWKAGDIKGIDAAFGVCEALEVRGVTARDVDDARKIGLTKQGQRWVGRFLNQGSLQGGLHDVFVDMMRAGPRGGQRGRG